MIQVFSRGGINMGEIVEIKKEELADLDIKSGIKVDANKIPKEKLRALFMDLKNLYGIGHAFMETIQDGEYVLKIPKDIKEGMDKGFYWFCDKKDGSGQLPDVWGFTEEGKKALKERLTVEKKIPMDGVSDALYNHAQQQQMAQMMEELKEIHEDVRQILQGQTDDRFAIIEGAYDQLKFANETADPNIRRDLIVGAIGKLTDGERKIYKTLQTKLERFKKIPQSKAGIYFKMFTDVKNYNDKKNKEADEICKYFDYYEKAMLLIAYSFSVLDEEKAVNKVYRSFEERVTALNTENFQTIQYLHPGMYLEDKWYMNKADYSLSLETHIKSLQLQNNEYFNLRIEGQLLKEVV